LGVLAAELAPGRHFIVGIWPPIGSVTGAAIRNAGTVLPFPLPRSDPSDDSVVVDAECGSQAMESDDWLWGLLIRPVADDVLF